MRSTALRRSKNTKPPWSRTLCTVSTTMLVFFSTASCLQSTSARTRPKTGIQRTRGAMKRPTADTILNARCDSSRNGLPFVSTRACRVRPFDLVARLVTPWIAGHCRPDRIAFDNCGRGCTTDHDMRMIKLREGAGIAPSHEPSMDCTRRELNGG